MAINLKSLMTYAHYADRIGVTQQSVRNYVKEGLVKSVNIDGRFFIVLSDEETLAWVVNNENK